MLQNGIPGSVQDISVRPFVTSFTPVVGGRTFFGPVMTSPIEERLKRLRQQAALENPGVSQSDAALLLGASQRNAASQPARTTSSSPRTTASSAAHGDISVAEIRRQKQAKPRASATDEVQLLIATARAAEVSGNLGAARLRYRKAAARATGQLRSGLLAKLESLAVR